VEGIRVADTRRVRGPARRLYAGVKKTKDGIEIKMRDQDKALDNIAKFLGMIVNKNEIAGPGGGPISTVNFTAEDLTDDQIATMLLKEASS
jgi:phage terminase small subunit